MFDFDVPGDPSEFFRVPLPASFSQDGLTMEASASGGGYIFMHTNDFSILFPHMSGGALTDGFLLTQVPGLPPSTLTLTFRAGIVAFAADFGVIVDSETVDDPTPASLRLEAFAGSQQLGSLIATPTGGPDIFEGVVAFAGPDGAAPFDRVVLTSLPAAFFAGSPEFILDNFRVTRVSEPPVAAVGLLALLLLMLLASARPGGGASPARRARGFVPRSSH